MAVIVTGVFPEEFKEYLASFTLTPDDGDAVVLTEPGEVVFEVSEEVGISATLMSDIGDLTWGVERFFVRVTKTDETEAEYTMMGFSGNALTFTFEEDEVSAVITPNVALLTYTAALRTPVSHMGLDDEDYPTRVVSTGHRTRMEVMLPEYPPQIDSYIFLGWSQLLPEGLMGVVHYVTYHPGDIIEIGAWPPYMWGTGYEVRAIFTPRNGVNSVCIGHNGDMRPAFPFVGQNGEWVPLNAAVGLQGEFETTGLATTALGFCELGVATFNNV